MRRKVSRSGKYASFAGGTASGRGSKQAVRVGHSRLPKAIALFVALILAFALFYISPIFRVSQITVVGAVGLPADKVAQAADVEGQNILAVDRDEVAKAVGQMPLVKSARVARKLPNELVITIEERQPWAVWQVSDAKYTIDDEGLVIGTAPVPGLITIVDTVGNSIKLGSRVEPKAVELARSLTQILPREMGALPKRFEFAPDTGLAVATDKGWQARFGDLEDLGYEVATLKAIAAAAVERKARLEFVDLRFSGRPYYR
ncbi:MAG: FtsQ-type POTRA domain-containing protein [Chloroflexi bacterium]|nr:FtsQ-type POTRA domain-containing protein [Chloroflexota bacterium]